MNKSGKNNPFYGKHHAKEMNRLNSISRTKAWKNGDYDGICNVKRPKCSVAMKKMWESGRMDKASEKISKTVKDHWKNGRYDNRIQGSNLVKVYYYRGMHLQGSYELRLCKIFYKLGIRCKRARRIFRYIGDDNKKHRYYPDFYLTDYNCYIEVKGWKRLIDNIKLESVRKQGKQIYMLMLKDIERLEDVNS